MSRNRTDLDPASAVDLPSRFALHLRAKMAEKGWASQDVADALTAAGLNIGSRAIDTWLRGESMPRPKDLEAVGTAFGLDDYRDILPPPLPRTTRPRKKK